MNNSQDDLIFAINDLITVTRLNEFEELKESIDNINLEANKIIASEKNNISQKKDNYLIKENDGMEN